MNWALLIEAIIQFLGPVLLAWIEKLLNRQKVEMVGKVPADAAVAIHDVFAAARKRLGLLDRVRGRGLVLDALQRVATGRARELLSAAGDGNPVVMSGVEYDEVAAVMPPRPEAN